MRSDLARKLAQAVHDSIDSMTVITVEQIALILDRAGLAQHSNCLIIANEAGMRAGRYRAALERINGQCGSGHDALLRLANCRQIASEALRDE